VLTNAGGVDLPGGALVLDYASGSNPAEKVKSLLTDAFGKGFLAGQIRNPSADSSIGLGWIDNAAAKQVLILPALYGDATCDGHVDFGDFAKLAANFGTTSGAVWAQGDFNYDGAVDLQDFAKLAANYNGTGPVVPGLADDAASPAMRAANVTEAPEPSTLVLLVALLATAAARAACRRRALRGGRTFLSVPLGRA